MRHSTVAFLALLLPGSALAQGLPAPNETTEDSVQEGPAPAPSPDTSSLEAELAAAKAEAAASGASLEWLEAIHDLAATLLDDRTDMGKRTEAAATLGRSSDPRTLVFFRAAAQSRMPALQTAVIDASMTTDHPDRIALVEWVIRDEASERAVRLHAVDQLSSLGGREAGLVLWELSGDSELDGRVRAAARNHLQAHYAELLAEVGGPKVVSDKLGRNSAILATANVGGTVLGAVGSWGRYDATGIGATGGSLIGGGGAMLFTRARPVTSGQGLAYMSAAGWGEALGGFAGVAILGMPRYTQWEDPKRDLQRDLMPAFLAVGVSGGAWAGSRIAQKQPDAWDVVEVDVATYLGTALAVSAVDVVAYHPSAQVRSGSMYSYNDRHARLRSGANILGGAGGAVVGVKLADRWELGWDDGLYAGLVGAEASWVGWWWPTAFGIDDRYLRGTLRLPLHASVIGALAHAERNPISYEQSMVGGFTGVSSNLLGAGIPRLFNDDSEANMARVMIPLGIAGTAAGVAGAEWADADLGGWSMVAVGVPLVAANTAVLADRAWWNDRITDTQAGGLLMTTTGAASLGLWAANNKLDPEWPDWAVVASGAGWGAFYGALLPEATRSSASDRDRRLLLMGLTDTGALAGGLVVGLDTGIEPIETVVPQLGGVAGATVAALGVAMVSTDEADLATGALVGAAGGFVGGSLLQYKLAQRGQSDIIAAAVPQRRVHLPGTWTPTFHPRVDQHGALGVQVGVQAVGW